MSLLFFVSITDMGPTGRGYFGGGSNGTSLVDIEGIDFSDSTSINPTAALSIARHILTGVSSNNRGYFCSGSIIDGIQFNNETAFNLAVSLTVSRTQLSSVQSATRGYCGGGIGDSYSVEIDGIQFSDETIINPTLSLSLARYDFAGVSSSAKGYFSGGRGSSSLYNRIDGINFADETAIPLMTLITARRSHAGVQS